MLRDLRFLAELEWICLRSRNVQPFLEIDNGSALDGISEKENTVAYEHPTFHKM